MLAELLLMFVTLIATAVLGGYVFGVIAQNEGIAMVSASGSTCTLSGQVETCELSLQNHGQATALVGQYCDISVSGTYRQGTVTGIGLVPAGGVLTGVGCRVSGVQGGQDGLVTGWLSMNSGSLVYFAARGS